MSATWCLLSMFLCISNVIYNFLTFNSSFVENELEQNCKLGLFCPLQLRYRKTALDY